MKFEFSADYYTKIRGNAPRGRRSWAFLIYDIDDKSVYIGPLLSPEMTLSEAKAGVKPVAKDLAQRLNASAQRVSIMVVP